MTIREVINLLTSIFTSLMALLAPLFEGNKGEAGDEAETEADA